MTSPIARLKRGADIIYFEQGTAYQLSEDFTPPGSSMAASFSGGTSANTYGGAVKTGEQAQNREVSFSVYCYASTKDNAAPQSLANRLVTMVSGAGDEVAPLWFEWTLTPGLPEPIWGQFGAWRRAEVQHGGAQYATRLGQFSRQEMVEVVVTLTVKPYALGTRHEVYYGPSNIIDRFGVSSFTPTGLRVPEDVINLIPNPVFGNRAAWNTNWTAANLGAYENIDLAYVYPGCERSALLICSATAGTYTTTVNTGGAAAHVFSAYVKKPDSSAVTSADCECYFIAPLATTYTLLGNGVYRLTGSANGTTSADAAGVSLSPNKTVYLLGMQMEAGAHFTPLAWGDQPGVVWASSAHDSTSTRALANSESYLQNYNHVGQASVAIVWKPDYASTEAGDRYLFNFNNGTSIYYTAADDMFNIVTGGAVLQTAAQTFAAGATLRIYGTWGASGTDIYINGTNAGTSATFTPIATDLTMGIGISAADDKKSGGLYRAVEFYDKKLTQAEITAIDNAFVAALSSDNIDTPPFMFTRAMTQAYSLSWMQYGLMEAIPGTASPLIDFENATYTDFPTNTEMRLSTLNGTQYMAVGSDGLYTNCTTAAIAVSASADEVLSTATIYRINELMGETVWIATRLTDAGANLQLDYKLAIGGTEVRIGYKNVTADGTQRVFFLGPLYIPSRAAFPERIVKNKNLTATGTLYAQRTTGGASNIEIDYVNIMLPNLVILKRTGTGSVAGTPYINYYDGEGANLYDDTTIEEYLRIIGGRLKLDPMRMNWINWQPGANGSANAAVLSMTYHMIITPRWAL